MKLQTAVDKLFSHKLFSNKYFLYAVVAASVLTNYMRMVDCRYEVVGFFILVGIIMMNFSKNVAVVLTVCLLLTQIIMAGQAVQEGLDNMTEETTLSQQIKSKKADITTMKARLEKATNQKETKIAERRKLRQNMKSAEDNLDKLEKKLKVPGLKNRGNIQDEKGRIKKQREQTRNTLERVNKQIDVDTASQTRLSNNIAKAEKELADLEKLRDEKRAARAAKAKADADAAKAKADAAAKAATPAATTATTATTSAMPASTTATTATAPAATASAAPATAASIPASTTTAKATPAKKENQKNQKNRKIRKVEQRIALRRNHLRNNFALLNESDDESEDDNAFDFMGPSDISGLTQGTTNLMTKQKDLFSFMNSMTPLIENAKKMLSGLDLSKLRA